MTRILCSDAISLWYTLEFCVSFFSWQRYPAVVVNNAVLCVCFVGPFHYVVSASIVQGIRFDAATPEFLCTKERCCVVGFVGAAVVLYFLRCLTSHLPWTRVFVQRSIFSVFETKTTLIKMRVLFGMWTPNITSWVLACHNLVHKSLYMVMCFKCHVDLTLCKLEGCVYIELRSPPFLCWECACVLVKSGRCCVSPGKVAVVAFHPAICIPGVVVCVWVALFLCDTTVCGTTSRFICS